MKHTRTISPERACLERPERAKVMIAADASTESRKARRNINLPYACGCPTPADAR